MKTTRTKMVKTIRALLAAGEHGERNCEAYGREIESAVRSLQFLGAAVHELRGLGDTGLTDEDFASMCYFRLPFAFSTDVMNRLDREVA